MAGLLSNVPMGHKYSMRFSRAQITGALILLALIWLIVIVRLIL
jgi:hypothetical protein